MISVQQIQDLTDKELTNQLKLYQMEFSKREKRKREQKKEKEEMENKRLQIKNETKASIISEINTVLVNEKLYQLKIVGISDEIPQDLIWKSDLTKIFPFITCLWYNQKTGEDLKYFPILNTVHFGNKFRGNFDHLPDCVKTIDFNDDIKIYNNGCGGYSMSKSSSSFNQPLTKYPYELSMISYPSSYNQNIDCLFTQCPKIWFITFKKHCSLGYRINFTQVISTKPKTENCQLRFEGKYPHLGTIPLEFNVTGYFANRYMYPFNPNCPAHYGFTCDVTKVRIYGTRYHKKNSNYDLGKEGLKHFGWTDEQMRDNAKWECIDIPI